MNKPNTGYVFKCKDCKETWAYPLDDQKICPFCKSEKIKEI